MGEGLRLRWEGWREFELDGEVLELGKKTGIVSFPAVSALLALGWRLPPQELIQPQEPSALA